MTLYLVACEGGSPFVFTERQTSIDFYRTMVRMETSQAATARLLAYQRPEGTSPRRVIWWTVRADAAEHTP